MKNVEKDVAHGIVPRMAFMTARLRYVAYLTEQPDALAAFYRERLQLDEMARSSAKDVYLTDGCAKLALLRSREDLGEARNQLGPHHIGFAVDDFEVIKARFRRLNPRALMVPETGKNRGEIRIYDPECNPVSLSRNAFGLDAGPAVAPKLRYLAFGALDPEALAEFYVRVFGLRPLAYDEAVASDVRPDRFVTDGHVVLGFVNYFGPNAGPRPRYGLSRCGFAAAAGSAGDRLELTDPDGNGIILAKSDGVGVQAWRA